MIFLPAPLRSKVYQSRNIPRYIPSRRNVKRAQKTTHLNRKLKAPQQQPLRESQQHLGAYQSYFQEISLLGQGSFGTVFKSLQSDGQIVAIKKTKIDPHYKNRELDIMLEIDFPYVNKLKNHFTEPIPNEQEYYLYLVLEFIPSSLRKEIKYSQKFQQLFSPQIVKKFSFQLFLGLAYLHSIKIAHRDIKPDNLLVDMTNSILKICDFGSAKKFEEDDSISVSYIASRWYRAPELLLGSRKYKFSVDIWSAGCVIAEMLLENGALFQGNNNDDQLIEIIRMLGYPTDEDMQSFDSSKCLPEGVEKILSLELALPQSIDPLLFDLLSAIFVYNTSTRPTAMECLKFPYFDELANQIPLSLLDAYTSD